METSASKRRRTSPRTAMPIQAQSEAMTPPDATPSASAVSGRPSFASPTRSSLERFNPDILRQRERQPRVLRSSPDAPTHAATPDSTGGLTRAMRNQLDLRSVTRHGGAPAASEGDSVLRFSPARRLGPGQTPTRPVPRPLPPPAPEHDEELLNAISQRMGSQIPPGVLPEVVVPEPELPPTPRHPDPVVSTPPSGIHNTPSRRPKRSRALGEKLKSSSPLKKASLRPTQLPQKGAPAELDLPARAQGAVVDLAPTPAELRGLKPADPDTEKKKLRDSLLENIRQLEHDLDVASTENERIRQARLFQRAASPPANAHEVLAVLCRHALPPDTTSPAKPDPVSSWLASALNPIAFLPSATLHPP
ncbi:hypothetical protein N0V88_001446 [Collariella sp. IMI 366227]|nr:hypothetical protein N0V88_001446 [Collariella sp. IMI 366227]